MKIKKTEYEKKLDDKYWEGVEAGIKFALQNPNVALKYADNIPALRTVVKNISNVVKNAADAISRLFRLEK